MLHNLTKHRNTFIASNGTIITGPWQIARVSRWYRVPMTSHTSPLRRLNALFSAYGHVHRLKWYDGLLWLDDGLSDWPIEPGKAYRLTDDNAPTDGEI